MPLIEYPERLRCMLHRTGTIIGVLLLAGCGAAPAGTAPSSRTADPSATIDAQRAAMRVSCGGVAFPAVLLEEPGIAETFDDPAAASLRGHLAEPGPDFEWLPDAGWREVVRTDVEVTYVADAAPGTDPPYAQVTIGREGVGWQVTGWGQCRLEADVGPDLGLASFRVAPGFELGPDTTEVEVLVTERACNSGQDARGRIAEPAITVEADSVTVVLAVRPRGGNQDCPSNPETPFVLTLSQPLGDRRLLDGSEVPARDATVCAEGGICPP